MKICRVLCLAATLMLAAGCTIQFATPAFPKDTGVGDSAGGDAGIDAASPDLPGPDGVEPDLPLEPCEALQGLCVGPGEDAEKNALGCPWGYEPVHATGCPTDDLCCVVSEACGEAGSTFLVTDDGVGCCPGLGVRDFREPLGFMNCEDTPEKYLCTDCGNEICDPWENPCVCEEDCPWGLNECKENGGECSNACPPLHEELPFGGCGEGQVCCALESKCLEEGMMAEYAPGSPPCCAGLESIPETLWTEETPDGSCKESPDVYVCADCGNGDCEEWESSCTCKQDCEPVDNLCVLEGNTCMGVCPDGWAPIYLPGCPPGKACCEESNPPCAGEGQSSPEGPMPGFMCCEGLSLISASMMGENGQCTDTPAVVCSACGNNWCEPWENQCNCLEDCEMGPPMECNPFESDSAQCPDSAFCAAPPYACGMGGPIGICIQIPMNCNDDYVPVCSCSGEEYPNECFAHQEGQTVAWFGYCAGSDGGPCVGLGEKITASELTSAECCGDLDQKPDKYLELLDQCIGGLGAVCVKCGDGLCGPGENECVCPSDCTNTGTPG